MYLQAIDAGTYICVATNELGYDTALTQLRIHSKTFTFYTKELRPISLQSRGMGQTKQYARVTICFCTEEAERRRNMVKYTYNHTCERTPLQI